MIAKGHLHGNGGRLATYLMADKNGERAELAELRGFLHASSIARAFTDIAIQARATNCVKPFFHGYVRLPEEEIASSGFIAPTKSKKPWASPARPALWFFIMGETATAICMLSGRAGMRAIDPGLFKNRLKEICRVLENELSLTRVSSRRAADEEEKFPLTRNAFEQARRLKTNIQEIRAAIVNCWNRSDDGFSFVAALQEQGLTLARGDRRDFVIVDHCGGIHALGKRITGIAAREIDVRLADLDRTALPGIGQARMVNKHPRAKLSCAAARPKIEFSPFSGREPG